MPYISFEAMGSEMGAALDGEHPRADAMIAALPRWFAAWERRLSRFSPQSELSRLNARAGVPQPASATLRSATRAAIDAARWTQGLVTPTTFEVQWGTRLERPLPMTGGGDEGAVDVTNARRAPISGFRIAVARDEWGFVTVDDRARTIVMPREVRLDLTGIAKGWAADRAAARLAAYGPALVDAGGDLAISGPRAGGAPWLVAVADPRGGSTPIAMIPISHGGIATSGCDYPVWTRDGRSEPVVDPRTSAPAATDVLTATVVAPSAWLAEAAAKVIVLMGSADGLAWIDANPTLRALIVLDDGTPLESRRFRHAA
jgi:FAD:protein FMN transferase